MMICWFRLFVQMFPPKSFGPEALAAYGIGLRIEQLNPAAGIWLDRRTFGPFVAQNFGAGDSMTGVRGRIGAFLPEGWHRGQCLSGLRCYGSRRHPWSRCSMTNFSNVDRLGHPITLHVEMGFIWPLYLAALRGQRHVAGRSSAPWPQFWIGPSGVRGIAVGLFCWLYVTVFDWGTWGVWFGIATAVISGLALSLWVLEHIARAKIGGLLATSQRLPAA